MLTVQQRHHGPDQGLDRPTYHELFITALVVAIIVLLFLGKLNTALSVILAIPIALSAAPDPVPPVAGFSLNLVSLLALIIAIGIVVDDSIVVAENVERYRAMGFGLKESVLKGASEVFSAVVAASLSLLSVLLPGELHRRLHRPLPAASSRSASRRPSPSPCFEAVLFLTVRLAYTPESKTCGWRTSSGAWLPAASRSAGASRSGARAPVVLAWSMVGIAVLLLITKPFCGCRAMVAYPLALGLAVPTRIVLSLLQSITDAPARVDRGGPRVGARRAIRTSSAG